MIRQIGDKTKQQDKEQNDSGTVLSRQNNDQCFRIMT